MICKVFENNEEPYLVLFPFDQYMEHHYHPSLTEPYEQ